MPFTEETKPKAVSFHASGRDLFVLFDGVKIAKLTIIIHKSGVDITRAGICCT